MSRGGRGAGMKREREVTNQPQVANQALVDILDPNHIKNENDGENDVEVTYENHPRTQEAIESAEEMTKLIMHSGQEGVKTPEKLTGARVKCKVKRNYIPITTRNSKIGQ